VRVLTFECWEACVEHKSADLVFGVVLNPLGAQRCNIKAKKKSQKQSCVFEFEVSFVWGGIRK
jgi:hypothetical protein